MTSGNIFRQAKMLIGANSAQMAQKLGVAPRTYKKYESGSLTVQQAIKKIRAIIDVEYTLILKNDKVKTEIQL